MSHTVERMENVSEDLTLVYRFDRQTHPTLFNPNGYVADEKSVWVAEVGKARTDEEGNAVSVWDKRRREFDELPSSDELRKAFAELRELVIDEESVLEGLVDTAFNDEFTEPPEGYD